MLYTENLNGYYTENRIWQGIPGIERTKNGRLLATFYSGGTKEEYGNFCVLIKSDDDGNSWSEPIAVAYNGQESRCYDPCLWIDPIGRLWFFWAVMPSNCVWCSVCEDPDADTLTWSKEKPIAPEVMINKPIVLSTGEWLLPITEWPTYMIPMFCKIDKVDEGKPYVYKSSDLGKTFVRCGGPIVESRSFDEHMVIERKDGSIVMYTRTKYGISESFSYDGGKVWTNAHDSRLGGPNSRFCIRRLKSGNLILINHYKFTGRNNLTAMISDDDGQTWKGFLLLDGRKDVSYPDLTEDDSGNIYVIYDRERGGFQRHYKNVVESAREILLCKISEKDILAGKIVTNTSFTGKVINKLVGENQAGKDAFATIEAVSSESYVKNLLEMKSPDEILQVIYKDYGISCSGVNSTSKKDIDNSVSEICASFEDKVKLKYHVISFLKIFNTDDYKDKNLPDYIIERIFKYVSDNFSSDFNLTDMADFLNISVFYMSHLFKEKTGISILQYRNELRIFNAKKQLINTNKSVNEIAQECGYATASYFSEIFKREENTTPQAYRELNKKK